MTNMIRIIFTLMLMMVATIAGTSSFEVEWNKVDESGICYNTTINSEEADQYAHTYMKMFGELPAEGQ